MPNLSRDNEAEKIQGFEPRNVITGTTDTINIESFIAFRLSGDADIVYVINGTTMPAASILKGAITVCANMTSMTCDTAVNIEVM